MPAPHVRCLLKKNPVIMLRVHGIILVIWPGMKIHLSVFNIGKKWVTVVGFAWLFVHILKSNGRVCVNRMPDFSLGIWHHKLPELLIQKQKIIILAGHKLFSMP
jgi:hypothetical protein